MIETERLILRPLNYSQLIKYTRNDYSLDEELNLNTTVRTISPELRQALEFTILPKVADDSCDYLFSTLWTAILKAENKMVGDLCFVGEPNEEGEIEIGYGTYEGFMGKGFMTEAVGGIIKWAKNQKGVLSIFAETDKLNIASFNVLEKNKFIKYGQSEKTFLWRLKLK